MITQEPLDIARRDLQDVFYPWAGPLDQVWAKTECNQVIYGPKMTKNWILSILAIFYYFHTKSCHMFEGLTHHLVGPQKWSSYWQKLETICINLSVLVYRSKWAQFRMKCNLVKMRFQNLCFGAKIKIFYFFLFFGQKWIPNGQKSFSKHRIDHLDPFLA